MIFSSVEFIFIFLPICALCYALLQKTIFFRKSLFLIFIASLVYYGYWEPKNLWIILASILFNYYAAHLIFAAVTYKKIFFLISIGLNLALLSYFKYTDFAISTLNTILGVHIPLAGIVLPIGISFFTFQQIAYLSDVYTQKLDPTHEGLLSYGCFVVFFPQLIAGPLVHHREMMPQFTQQNSREVNWENIYCGIVMFSIGLAKKVLIADNLSPAAIHAFDKAASLTFLDACLGSIVYTLQLYFDFSGYADMAIGCALLFNIHLPQNFYSPYKATNIQIFWRKWHITLSRWLRDYLYIPLGGSRTGKMRTLVNLFITFLLGGLWHGAAWTFVLWGAMHGCALIVHRTYSQIWQKQMPVFIGWFLTFTFVNMAWVVFRAPTFERLDKFLDAFLGYNGLPISHNFMIAIGRIVGAGQYPFTIYALFVLFSLILAITAKNSHEIIGHATNKPKIVTTSLAIFCLFFSIMVLLSKSEPSEFLYFQF